MIKTFESIKDAYDCSCCICNNSMQGSLLDRFSIKSINDTSICFDRNPESKNFITLNLANNTTIVFNKNSGEIISFSIFETALQKNIASLGVSPWNSIDTPNINYVIYNGEFIVGQTILCSTCSMYDYTLQLFMDLNNRKVTKAILNSEFVTISDDDDENIYEIRNVYTLNKTEYTHISKKVQGKTLKLPLISDNMKNPKNVLQRIKKLLMFS